MSEIYQLTLCLLLGVKVELLDVFGEKRKIDEKGSAFERCWQG
jgi:hypothetical protein